MPPIIQQNQSQVSANIPLRPQTPLYPPAVGGFLAELDSQAREQKEAKKRASIIAAGEQGQIQQSTRPANGLVLADPAAGPEQQEAFQRGARDVQAVQLKISAGAAADEIEAANKFDPDGFASSFEKYARDTTDAIERDDPLAAANARLVLSGTYAQSLAKIQQNAATQAKAESEAAFLQTVQDTKEQGLLRLAAGGGEDDLLDAQTSIEEAYKVGQSQFQVSPAQAFYGTIKAKDEAAQAFVDNSRADAEARGDVGGLLALAKKLEAGAYYSTPLKAAATARTLRRQALTLSKKDNAETDFAARRLSALATAAASNIPVDPNEIEAAYQQAVSTGSASARDRASRDYVGYKVLTQYVPKIQNASDAELNAMSAEVGKYAAASSDSALTTFGTRITAEKAEREKARLSGDPLLNFQNFDVLTATDQDFNRRQVDAAVRANLPVDSVLKVKREELVQGAKNVESLLRSGNVNEADAAIERIGTLAGGPDRVVAALGPINTVSGAAGLGLALTSVGAAGEKKAFYAAYAAGADAPAISAPDVRPVAASADVRAVVQAASYGNRVASDSLLTGLETARKGAFRIALAQGVSPESALKQANAEVDKIVFALKDARVELPNGQYVLKSALAGPNVFSGDAYETVQDAVAKTLRDPAAFGESYTPDDLKKLLPIPLPNGTIKFFDPRSQQLLVNGPTIKSAELLVQAAKEEAEEGPSVAHQFVESIKEFGEQDFDRISINEETTFEKQTKLPAGAVSALRLATIVSPTSERFGVSNYNLPSQDAAAMLKTDVIVPAKAAAYLLKQYTNMYGPDDAIYAYALGRKVYEEIRKTGPDWKVRVPVAVERFVSRYEVARAKHGD